MAGERTSHVPRPHLGTRLGSGCMSCTRGFPLRHIARLAFTWGMLQHLLASREQGVEPPWLLPAVYGSERLTRLQLSREKELVRAHSKAVTSLDIDESGRYLLSGGADTTGTVAIHDLQKPLNCHNYKCPIVASTAGTTYADEPRAVSVVQWYPHDTGIFSTSSADQLLKIWDTNELMVVEKFSFTQPIYSHSMAAASSHCLTAVGGRECKITLCDIQSGSSTHILRGHRKPVMSLKWSPRNDHVLASGSHDNRILLWDVRKANGPLLSLDQHNGSGSSNQASVVTAHNGHVNGLSFSSDGLYLVSIATDNEMRLWDTFTGRNTLVNYGRLQNSLQKQTCQFAITPHTSTLHPVICVPSGGDVVMVEMLTGVRIRKLQGHFGKVTSLVTHPYEQELYSGGSDTNILVWSPPPLSSPSSSHERTGRSRAAAVYEDTWSSDEEN